LYQARRTDGSGWVMLGEVGQTPREVMPALSNAQYVEPGYLVFARESSLIGQRFDTSSGHVTGEPFSIADPVHYMFSTSATTFTTSRTGVLAYQSHLEEGRLVWLDRTGRELGTIGEPTGYLRVRISPDGRSVLFSRQQPRLGTYDLWTLDIERNVEQRLTSDRTSEINPVWLPGAAIAFSADRAGPPHLFRKDLASGAETEMQPGRGLQISEDVSPDGKTLLFTQRLASTFDIWTLPLNAPGKAAPLFETPFDEASVRFSPDGRFIAFASDESGRSEIYVAPFPPTGAKTRVSTIGGSLPRWRRDGQELFYVSADRHLSSVPVRTTPSLVLGAPQPLFAVLGGTVWSDPKGNSAWTDFDVSLDGKRFLAVIPRAANQLPLTVVLNWPAEVRR
jgi:dipeptidyl aminopeptidase/acylaminoacyl peptidase